MAAMKMMSSSPSKQTTATEDTGVTGVTGCEAPSSCTTTEDTGVTGCLDCMHLLLVYKDTKHCCSHAMSEDTGAMGHEKSTCVTTEDTGVTAYEGCSSHRRTEDTGSTGREEGMHVLLVCEDTKYRSSHVMTENRSNGL